MRIGPHREDEGEEPSREDADFARQLAAVLRTAESPRADFDARVRAAVLAVHAAPSAAVALRSRSPGWRRNRTITLSPVAWTALAAGFAAVVSLGTLSASRMNARSYVPQVDGAAHVSAAVPQAHDTVYVMRFVLADARARTVSLVGDFNAWARRATPLTHAKPGVWTAQVALPAGRHQYAFLVDGKRWVVDPAAEQLADDFDTPSSVVTVGTSQYSVTP